MSLKPWLLSGIIVVPLLSVAIIGANKRMNYVPLVASATGFETRCYLEKVEKGLMTKTTTTSETLPCEEAERLKADHPAFRDRVVKGEVDVAFDYVSPADNSQHSGRLRYSYEKFKRLLPFRYGDSVPILAHKTEPLRVIQDYDPIS